RHHPADPTRRSSNLITATSTTFNATNLESAGTVTQVLCTGTGTVTNNATARTFPDATVFDWYKANGKGARRGVIGDGAGAGARRSEEHTSELQSPDH